MEYGNPVIMKTKSKDMRHLSSKSLKTKAKTLFADETADSRKPDDPFFGGWLVSERSDDPGNV